MSARMDLFASRPERSRWRAWSAPAAAVLLLVAMALDTHVVRIGSKDDARTTAFAPDAYARKAFPAIQAAIVGQAVDAVTLAAAIASDKAAAGDKYGKPGSIGPIFPVKFSGKVGEMRSGVATVDVDGLPAGLRVRVQLGPAINGTDVRDATGTVSFGQFTNQMEYQDAGSALNDEIKSRVLAGLDRGKLAGKTVDVVGVFQLINPAGWLVTPVSVRVQ